MDACDPGLDINNLRTLVKQNTGTELKLSKEQICDIYMDLSRAVNYHYHPLF